MTTGVQKSNNSTIWTNVLKLSIMFVGTQSNVSDQQQELIRYPSQAYFIFKVCLTYTSVCGNCFEMLHKRAVT